MTTETVSSSGSNISFFNTYDSTVTANYQACIVAAENDIEARWTCSAPLTINEDFTAAAEGLNGDLASNSFYIVTVTYSQLKNALAAHDSGSVYAQDGVAALPVTDPSGGAGWSLPEAYAQMLGLTGSNSADTVTLNTSYNWSYGQDVINTIEHEITEGGMGRIGGLGDQNNFWSTMDLFRYSAAGVPDYQDGRDQVVTYFSYNGGATLSTLSYNNEYSGSRKTNSGDTADFTQLDVFGTGDPGETNALSQTDQEEMDVLGWTPLANPDVEIVSLTPANATATAGGSISVDAEVKNAGNASAGSFSTAIYISPDSTYDSKAKLLTTFSTTSLGVNASVDLTKSVTIPSTLASGSYYLIAVADSGNNLTDLNPANNSYSTQITVKAAATLYDFYFIYPDGSYYYGTVADNGSYGYSVGETVYGTTQGYYYIYSSAGATSEAAGTVSETYYYDSYNGLAYTPSYTAAGTAGLNKDLDYVYSNAEYQAYGYGGYYEAGTTSLTEPKSTLPVANGGAATISREFLWSYDIDNASGAALTNTDQITYAVQGLQHGALYVDGKPASSFTQADIDNGLVQYRNDGDGATSDGFWFTVSDPAGHQITEYYNIAVVGTAVPVVDGNVPLQVASGDTGMLLEHLSAVALGDQPSDITYTVSEGPQHGILIDNGKPATSFTQADVDDGYVQYHSVGDGATSDSFSFTVSDAAGDRTAPQTFNIAIGAAQSAATSGSAADNSSANIALLASYAASSFATPSEGYCTSLVSDPSLTAAQLQPLLTQPHS
jgi:Cadherin-like/CARDB